MIRILKITVVGLVLGTIALVLALALSWSFSPTSSFATSSTGQILSVVVSWPFVVTRWIPYKPGSDTTFILAVVINYGFYILLAWLLSCFRRKRTAGTA